MDVSKHLEFFNPLKLNKEIHILGVGATGSNIAVQLVRLGIEQIHIWDFDTVDERNISNQTYTFADLGKPKTEALKEYLVTINPNVQIITHKKYTMQPLKGILFFCIDSIEQRHKIAQDNQYNLFIELVIETRIGLELGQVFVTKWQDKKAIEEYIALLDFKDSESAAPVSACGTFLAVSPTILMTTAIATAEFINYIKTGKTQKQIHFNAFTYKIKAY